MEENSVENVISPSSDFPLAVEMHDIPVVSPAPQETQLPPPKAPTFVAVPDELQGLIDGLGSACSAWSRNFDSEEAAPLHAFGDEDRSDMLTANTICSVQANPGNFWVDATENWREITAMLVMAVIFVFLAIKFTVAVVKVFFLAISSVCDLLRRLCSKKYRYSRYTQPTSHHL